MLYRTGSAIDDFIRLQEQRLRDCQPERPGGLEIDHQFELSGLLDRKIGRPGAFDDLVDEGRRTAVEVGTVRPIAINPPSSANSQVP